MRFSVVFALLATACFGQEPEETLRRLLTALRTGDRNAALSYLADPTIVYSAGGDTTPALQLVGPRAWDSFRGRIAYIRHLVLPTAETAFAVVIWKNPGAQSPDDTGTYDVVLRKESNKWKVFTWRAAYLSGVRKLPVRHASKPDADGWRSLFDGTSFDGWTTFQGQSSPPEGWVIKNGVLATETLPRASLRSEEEFSEFELVWEWKVSAAGNSGVLYLLVGESGAGGAGLEYQIADDNGDRGAMQDDRQKSGAVYGVVPVRRPSARPLGEWNESRIFLRSNHVEHWLNGSKVAEYDLEGIFSSPISLQHHGPGAFFRNIRIRTLSEK